MKRLFLVLLIPLTFLSCEKDDICDSNTPTTSKVVIDFYDIAQPTNLKLVTNLAIKETGGTTIYQTFDAVSRIKIPLKTLDTSTKYDFILNYSSTPTVYTNTDQLQFIYATSNVFVSRACGFKTEFALNSSSPVKTDGVDGAWIQNIVVNTTNINNENETHIKIYF